MAKVATSSLGRVTVPLNFLTDVGGNWDNKVKMKMKKGVDLVKDPLLRPNMDLKPEYSDLYAACFEECRTKFAGRTLREIGAKALILSEKKIKEIESKKPKPQQAAQPAGRTKMANPVKGNSLADWEAAFDEDPREDLQTVGGQWQELDEDVMSQLEAARNRPSQKTPERKSQVIEMNKTASQDGWSDGFVQRRQSTASFKSRAREPELLTDLFGIPGLGIDPAPPSGYALLSVPQGDLRFRFHWMLRDEDAGKWVTFVQDTRSPECKDVRQYLEHISEGAGEIRITDDPAELEQSEMTMVNTLVNTIKFGDFVLIQFFLIE